MGLTPSSVASFPVSDRPQRTRSCAILPHQNRTTSGRISSQMGLAERAQSIPGETPPGLNHDHHAPITRALQKIRRSSPEIPPPWPAFQSSRSNWQRCGQLRRCVVRSASRKIEQKQNQSCVRHRRRKQGGIEQWPSFSSSGGKRHSQQRRSSQQEEMNGTTSYD